MNHTVIADQYTTTITFDSLLHLSWIKGAIKLKPRSPQNLNEKIKISEENSTIQCSNSFFETHLKELL